MTFFLLVIGCLSAPPSLARDTQAQPFVVSAITNSATVEAPVEALWDAWTTSEGAAAWLAPAAEIDAQPGGVFRAIYRPEATRVIDRGTDGLVIALEENKMVTFTWMTPLHMEPLKGNSTVVTAQFYALGPNTSRVNIVNYGYGQGDLWQQAHAYNVKGWDRILSALEYRFENGPMDWEGRIKELKSTGKISYWREHRAPKPNNSIKQ